MSLDIYLQGAHCSACSRDGERFYEANITHNVAPMWHKAGLYEVLYRSDGKCAFEIVETLERGYEHMSASPKDYLLLNPANGWGSYDSALVFLRKLIHACRAYPSAIISISA